MTSQRTADPVERTVFLGSGGFGLDSLRRLRVHPGIELVGVVTTPSPGRPTPIAAEARRLGIEPILAPDRLRAPESVGSVLDLRPGLLVLADYGQIVPGDLLGLPAGALNLHPSLLPRHRGATPIPAAILAGDRATGVSLIRMDAGVDTGPIVAVERVPLDGTETGPGLERTLAAVAADVLERSLGPWIRGELEPRPQGASGVTMTGRLRREDGRLDPGLPAETLERRVRALQPWPGSFVETAHGRIVVWAATADQTGGPPRGTFDGAGLGVGDGQRLALIEVQPAGGRRMSWEAYRRGRPGIVGSAVVPGP